MTASVAVDWWASTRWYAQRAALATGLPLWPRNPAMAAAVAPPHFDRRHYLRANPDVALAGYDPLAHYLRFGRGEGRGGAPAEEPRPDDASVAPAAPLPPAARSRNDRGGQPIDVIVPVYGSAALTLRAIDSALAAPVRRPFELVVVDDASPDPALCRALAERAEAGLITLLVNDRNVGFAASVNRGLALHRERDAVLLNSDTRVFGDWLDRLFGALDRDPRGATATPLSNAATILSYPIRLRDNVLPMSRSAEALDTTCRDLALPPLRVPTAIGFCMAIRRACLDRIGPFDVLSFGRGYGEENDFCCRASRAGWHHLATPNIFVWHRGGASFGAERQQRNAAAQRVLERLHPGYRASVRRFIRHDPLHTVRAALDAASIRTMSRRRVLHLEPLPRERPPGTLRLQLVPDLAPWAGCYRIVARSRHATLNLPRLDRYRPVAALADLLRDLGLDGLCLGKDGAMDRVLRRRLQAAARLADVPVVRA